MKIIANALTGRKETKMKIIIFKTNNYPHYEKTEERFADYESAMKRFEQLSKELCCECNAGKLQDYELRLCK